MVATRERTPQFNALENPRHKTFVDAMLIDPNQTQAYISAGYSENGASVGGTRLVADPKVSRALEAEREAQSVEGVRDASLVWDTFAHLASHAKLERDRIAAAKELGKLMGLYVTRVETHSTVTHALSLSPSQLARMEAIYQEPIESKARVVKELPVETKQGNETGDETE